MCSGCALDLGMSHFPDLKAVGMVSKRRVTSKRVLLVALRVDSISLRMPISSHHLRDDHKFRRTETAKDVSRSRIRNDNSCHDRHLSQKCTPANAPANQRLPYLRSSTPKK